MNRMEIDGCDIIWPWRPCRGTKFSTVVVVFLSITSCLFPVIPLPRVMEHEAL
jgi:hypothetical protein